MITEQQDRYQQIITRAIQQHFLTCPNLIARLRACELQEVTTQGAVIVSVISDENYWWLSHGHWASWLKSISGEHIIFVMEKYHA